MYNFNNILEKALKTEEIMIKDLIYSESDSQSFYRMVKNYYAENPEASDSEVYEYFENLFNEISFENAKLPNMRNYTIEYSACQYLNEHPKECREVYDSVIAEEKEKGTRIYSEEERIPYSSNRLSALRTFTMQGISVIRRSLLAMPKDIKEETESFLKLSKKEQNKILKELSFADRKEVRERCNLLTGDEFDKYNSFLKDIEQELEENLKEEYIYILEKLGERFKQFGILPFYTKKQNDFYRRVKLKDMSYPLKSEEDVLGVEDLFLRKNLEKLSVNQLSLLSTFWLNRFTKELESTNKAFFITKNMGTLNSIKNAVPNKNTGNIKIDIDEEQLKYLYEKMNFLHKTMNIMFKESDSGEYETIEEEFEVDGRIRRVLKIDSEKILSKVENEMGEEYKAYFSKKQPEVFNDLKTDILDFQSMENAKRNIYKLKDANMIAILFNLYKKEFSTNWGIILDKKSTNPKMILLAIDLKGLNMPIRLHIDRDIVEEFLRANQNTTLIPIYDGEKDFNCDGSFIATNILMPICRRQRVALKEAKANNQHPYKNLVEHIGSLATGDYPAHLKIDVPTGKKGIVSKRRPPRRYFDLATSDVYVEKDKGRYEKVEQRNSRIIEGR